jgi:hypothetical protein
MRRFKTVYGTEYEESFCGLNRNLLLHDLEIQAKEVKCRKSCQCSACHSIIQAGDLALKTIQRCDHRYSGFRNNAYCQECYREIKKISNETSGEKP